MTFNEITATRSNTDKSGNDFKTLTLTCTSFSQMTHPVTGAVVNALGSSSQQTVNAWANSSVESPYNHLYNAAVGTAVVGTLVSREVEPYQIEDNIAGESVMRTVTTYSCFVAEAEDSARFESAVRSAFRWNGHPLANNNDEATAVTAEPAVEVDFGA